MTKKIISYFSLEENNISYVNDDMLNISMDEKFDFITMGEVLEHVAEPSKLLIKLKDLITNNGTIYISTCVDCPSIDHVYHFKSVTEIENMIKQSGFRIIDKLVLPVEEKSMKEIIKNKITINYCGYIRKKIN